MDIKRIKAVLSRKSPEGAATQDATELTFLSEFSTQPDVLDYLKYCLPRAIVGASGVRLLPLAAIKQEMAEGAAPGSFIRSYGYLVIATSVGGNTVCVHLPSGAVFWADHTSFSSDTICFKDRGTGEWRYLHEYSAVNVAKALVLLSDKLENFLSDLLSDKLQGQLDALD